MGCDSVKRPVKCGVSVTHTQAVPANFLVREFVAVLRGADEWKCSPGVWGKCARALLKSRDKAFVCL